jgi:hypothetical protein
MPPNAIKIYNYSARLGSWMNSIPQIFQKRGIFACPACIAAYCGAGADMLLFAEWKGNIVPALSPAKRLNRSFWRRWKNAAAVIR